MRPHNRRSWFPFFFLHLTIRLTVSRSAHTTAADCRRIKKPFPLKVSGGIFFSGAIPSVAMSTTVVNEVSLYVFYSWDLRS